MIHLHAFTPLASIQAPADTVVTMAARDGFDLLLAVAAGIFALVFLVMLAGLLFVFYQIHQAMRSVGEVKDRIASDPAVESLRKTSANVESISATLRNEVAELSRSVGHLSDRLTQASNRMEERIEDFNALMEVMQEEAEDVFVDTAATARGVRRGIGELQRDRKRGGRLRGERPRERTDRRRDGDRRSPADERGEDGNGQRGSPTPDAVPGSHPFVDTEL
jgi:uncharacterized protein YoxC